MPKITVLCQNCKETYRAGDLLPPSKSKCPKCGTTGNKVLQMFEKCDPKAPWNQPNEGGDLPGEICCMRAVGGRCYEHSPENYPNYEKVEETAKAKLDRAENALRDMRERVEHSGTFDKMMKDINRICHNYWSYKP